MKVSAKWRIAAASVVLGLLLCSALLFTIESRAEAVRASAQAHLAREDAFAAERALTAFWKEREAMGEFLAFPHEDLGGEVRNKRLRLRRALEVIGEGSATERFNVERAKAGNEEMMALFYDLPRATTSLRNSAGARRLHLAERLVLEPIEQLKSSNRRDNHLAEAAADSAERSAFRTELVTAILGLLAVSAFGVFAVRQVRRIDNQNVELQAADLAKDDFISTVSHELRTPLTSIRGYVELLLEEDPDPLTEHQRGFLATVLRGAVRLEQLVNDLLFSAQASAGHIDVQKSRADIVEITSLAVESAQAHARQKVLQLNLLVPSHAIVIDADALRMGQAIDNVISNAIKFTPENGRVDVILTQDAGDVRLTVNDTGAGMTATDIGRLFERFFRTSSAQTQHIQGTGLGLPIVKAIVEAHGGAITVTSEPGVGTSFVISLPLARPLGIPATAGQQDRLVAA